VKNRGNKLGLAIKPARHIVPLANEGNQILINAEEQTLGPCLTEKNEREGRGRQGGKRAVEAFLLSSGRSSRSDKRGERLIKELKRRCYGRREKKKKWGTWSGGKGGLSPPGRGSHILKSKRAKRMEG